EDVLYLDAHLEDAQPGLLTELRDHGQHERGGDDGEVGELQEGEERVAVRVRHMCLSCCDACWGEGEVGWREAGSQARRSHSSGSSARVGRCSRPSRTSTRCRAVRRRSTTAARPRSGPLVIVTGRPATTGLTSITPSAPARPRKYAMTSDPTRAGTSPNATRRRAPLQLATALSRPGSGWQKT